MQQCSSRVGISMVQYSTAEGNTLLIEECDTNSYDKINVENAEVTYISLHGVTAIVLRQPYEEINVIWSMVTDTLSSAAAIMRRFSRWQNP
jgi:hypothetical protein